MSKLKDKENRQNPYDLAGALLKVVLTCCAAIAILYSFLKCGLISFVSVKTIFNCTLSRSATFKFAN